MMAQKKELDSSRTLRLLNKFGPFLALILVYAFFAVLNSRIVTFTALETIIQQSVIVGVAAIGMTLVIITGGIDLSAGSNIAFCSVVVALLMQSAGLSPFFAACGGVIAGMLWGMVNGLLITKLKLVPFIVTLGTLLIIRGFAKGLSSSMPIDVGSTWLSDLLASLPSAQKWQLIPPGAWLMIGLALLIAGLLKYSRLGRHIFAVGSNEQTEALRRGCRQSKNHSLRYSRCIFRISGPHAHVLPGAGRSHRCCGLGAGNHCSCSQRRGELIGG
jgi:ribose/xylose/arabinose/galactoside ABC-type transport system permease subunit